MASQGPRTVIVTGVSGTGKTTVGRALAERTGWTFADGDDFHAPEAVATMASGRPLTDQDRWPWLDRIAAWTRAEAEAGRSAVVACSALRRSYRDVLRDGGPDVAFCVLSAPVEVVRRRLAARRGHFMPAALLESQLACFEPLAGEEPGATVSAEGTVDEVVESASAALGLLGR